MSDTQHTPGDKWTAGLMGNSQDDGEVWYVRTISSDPLAAMIDGPDVCLCASEVMALQISRLPDLKAENVRLTAQRDALAGAVKQALQYIVMAHRDAQEDPRLDPSTKALPRKDYDQMVAALATLEETDG